MQGPLASSSKSESSGEHASNAQTQQFVSFGEHANFSYDWQRLNCDPKVQDSLREAHVKLVQHQIEVQ